MAIEPESMLNRLTPFHLPLFGDQREKFATYQGVDGYYIAKQDEVIKTLENGIANAFFAGMHPDAMIDAVNRFATEHKHIMFMVTKEAEERDAKAKV